MNVIVSGGRLEPSPPDTPVRAAHLWLDAAESVRDPLFRGDRRTVTPMPPGAYEERPVAQADLRKLEALVSDKEVRVVFLTDAKARGELASMIVEATQRIIADPQMSGDSARWFRTGRREVDAHRDGIGIDSSGVSRLVAAGAKLLPDLDLRRRPTRPG